MTKRMSSPVTEDEIQHALFELGTVEGIAVKLWWGWTPMVSQKKWLIPGNPKGKPMKQEEREWFTAH